MKFQDVLELDQKQQLNYYKNLELLIDYMKQSKMGKQKKKYVETFLTDLGIRYDQQQIDNLIESAVLELKKELETTYESN